jgi:hypothetical protein
MSARPLTALLCGVLSFGVVSGQTPGGTSSVKGRFEEVNIGKFDLVDGIARLDDGGRTIGDWGLAIDGLWIGD